MKINYASGGIVVPCVLPSVVIQSLMASTHSPITWVLWGLLNIVAWRVAYQFIVLEPISIRVPTGLRCLVFLLAQGLFWYLLIAWNVRP